MTRNFGTRKKTGKKVASVKPGTYSAKIVYADYDDDYVAESAFVIKYELTAEDGTTLPYSEVFFSDERNPRTQEFYDYLEDHQIYTFDDLIGKEEILVIKKTTAGRGLVTIESRQFVETK